MAEKTRREQLLELLAEEPNDPFLLYGLAMESVSAGDDEDALVQFRSLIKTAPDYVPAYLQAGQTAARLERTEEAREFFQEGMSVARRVGDSHAAGEMQGMLLGLD